MTSGTAHIAITMRDGAVRVFEDPAGRLALTTYGVFVVVMGADEHVHLPAGDIAEIVARAPSGGRT